MAERYHEEVDERDLILAPNEFAYLLDETKGHVQIYTGPHKSSPAGTDQPVIFNEESKRFIKCSLEQSKQKWMTAPEGWYIVLKNPSANPASPHPKPGQIENLPEMDVGKKINIRGPVTFPLWPGQMAKVIKGHHLRSNQFLVVRVYDEEAARENWNEGVMKTRDGEDADLPDIPDLTIGKLLVIKGTEVSFYIPPTGVEVVNQHGEYIRDAVTLENLEYCILLDEDGNKEFKNGPAVVFPEPTQTFVEKDGIKKFRALELNKLSGVYVKVIEDYVEPDGTERKAGEELWITGKEQSLYLPRREHAIIKYGDQTIHYAVTIPKGEGRYLLDRDTGEIKLIKGPDMLLPDPRKYVIARRVLPEKVIRLWYPGNTEAIDYNKQLEAVVSETKSSGATDVLSEDVYRNKFVNMSSSPYTGTFTASGTAIYPDSYKAAPTHDGEVVGEDFNRKQKFTPPRTVTIDSKYDGAVRIDVWRGYAVSVSSATGDRRVVVGPNTVLLDYDETLEKFELSRGNPKSSDNTVKDVYLQVLNNKVSDTIEVETKDMCRITLQLSYRVNFEGDHDNWFNVENYVQFLVDHIRSLLKNLIRHYDIKSFYGDPISVIRDSILGIATEEDDRPGRLFKENGMRIYDVEVLNVVLDDQGIEGALIEAQQEAIKNTIFVASKEQELDRIEKVENIQRLIAAEKANTTLNNISLEMQENTAVHKQRMKDNEEGKEAQEYVLEMQREKEEFLNIIKRVELERWKNTQDIELQAIKDKNLAETERQKAITEVQINKLKAEVEAIREKLSAMGPEVAAAINLMGDKELAQKIADSVSWHRLIGGENPGELLNSLLTGTKVKDVVSKLTGNNIKSRNE